MKWKKTTAYQLVLESPSFVEALTKTFWLTFYLDTGLLVCLYSKLGDCWFDITNGSRGGGCHYDCGDGGDADGR